MSSFNACSGDSQASPVHPTPPDFVALAASLQEVAQSLLAHVPQEHKDAPPKTPVRRDEGETRSFYFPPAAVHMEKDLLRKYHATDFQGLLDEVHTLLVGLVKIMQSVHKDVRVRGYVITSLGAQLEHASALVLRMRHIYERVVPVQR